MTLNHLHILQGKFKNLYETCLSYELTNEQVRNSFNDCFNILSNSAIYRFHLTFAESLFDIRRNRAMDILRDINKTIDDEIVAFRFKMICNRLTDKSATIDTIGVLYILPLKCLMMIASN